MVTGPPPAAPHPWPQHPDLVGLLHTAGLGADACTEAPAMDVVIAIRTGIVKSSMLFVQAAAGAGADSEKEKE